MSGPLPRRPGRRDACRICGAERVPFSLGVCAACLRRGGTAAAGSARRRLRRGFDLVPLPPRGGDAPCDLCVHLCAPADGQRGYCGVRRRASGRWVGGRQTAGATFFLEPLPGVCLGDPVCESGHGPGAGSRSSLAVFYEACTFDCLYCTSWHFRQAASSARVRADDVARTVRPTTDCVLFSGGEPTPHVEHALRVARRARERRPALRVCWETNGAASVAVLDRMAEASRESGGCVKVSLKAWDGRLHEALTGARNDPTLENFARLATRSRRSGAPVVAASTLLVPGYVDAGEVERIAGFIAALDPETPYTVLPFVPAFALGDLAPTTRAEIEEAAARARAAGLRRVRVGNGHLLA